MTGRPKTVFLRGTETELAGPVAAALLARGATVAVHDAAEFSAQLRTHDLPGTVLDLGALGPAPDAPFDALAAQDHRLDAVIHLHMPDAGTDEASLHGFSNRLRPLMAAALDHLQRIGSQGIVINQFMMPTLLADSPLASAMVEARNALAALTRNACVRYGKSGIRTTALLVGLLDLPSLRALASERVNAAKTPLGRWITADEVAGTLAFLSLDSGYMSGQMLVLDGGMTGGLNGV